MLNNREIGKLGESLAEKYLISKQFKILEKNFRTRNGEIDIIATEGSFLVFIEVKTRRNITYGYPREAVNYNKQIKIKQIACAYLNSHKLSSNHNCNLKHLRFDVIEVMLDEYFREKSINLLKNAF